MKEKWKSEFFVLWAVFILFLLSLSRYCMQGEPRQIMSDDTIGQSLLSFHDGMEIMQPLTITEEMDWRQGEYALLFQELPAEEQENGVIHFRIEQGQQAAEQATVSIQELKSRQNQLGERFGEGIYVPLPLDFTKLSAKEAALYMTTEGVSEGELLLVCGKDYYGFGETLLNGKGCGMTLFQKYSYHLATGEYKLRLLCYGTVVLCMIFLSLLLLGKEESKKQCYAVFAVLTGMFLAVFYIYDSSVMLEPTYAEAVTNFMKFAREKSFTENLFLTDAGYLPLFPRLITLFFIKLLRFPAAEALYLMQMCACILCCMMWTFFCLYPFRKYMPLALRVVFCIITMAVCFHSETLFFTNFPYWGILPILLILLSDMKAWNKAEFWMGTGFGMLICLSKGAYAVIFPFMLLYLLFFYTELNRRQKVYGFGMAGAALLQIFYSFSGSGDGSNWIRAEQLGELSYLLKLFCKSMTDVVSYWGIWLGKYMEKAGVLFGIGAILIVGCLLFCFVWKLVLPKLHKERTEEKWMHFYTILLFLAITVVFYRVTTKVTADTWLAAFTAEYGQMGDKYEIFCDIAGLLLLMLGISCLADKERVKKEQKWIYSKSVGMAVLFLAFCITSPRLGLKDLGSVTISDGRTYEGNLNVSWAKTKDIIKKDAFFLPVRGEWWSYSKNVTVYQVGEDAFFEESKGSNLGEMEPGYRSCYTLEEGMPSENLLEIWIHNPNRITGAPYKIRLENENGTVLQEVTQFGGTGNSKAGFVLDTPVNGVKTIQFLDCNGNEIYIDHYICWISAW